MSRPTGPLLASLTLLLLLAAGPAVAAPPPGATRPAAPPAAADVGGIGLRLIDLPAAADQDPRARLYITDHVAPGTTITRRIEVSNTTSAATTVGLYAAAASIVDGSFLGAGGSTANELSTWTSVVPASSTLPTGSKVTATVTIAVPKDAAPGEQYGVVWAEARTPPKDNSGVTQVNRVGIRLYLSVGPGGPPAADFTIDSLTASRSAAGVPSILARVHNTGGRALDMGGSLLLRSGPGGLNAGPFPASLGVTLAIGRTEPVTVLLDTQLPAGPWDAQITMRSGLVERVARATVTFPASGSGPAVKVGPLRPAWLYPGLAASTVAIAAIGAALYRRPRLRRLGSGTSSARHGR